MQAKKRRPSTRRIYYSNPSWGSCSRRQCKQASLDCDERFLSLQANSPAVDEDGETADQPRAGGPLVKLRRQRPKRGEWGCVLSVTSLKARSSCLTANSNVQPSGKFCNSLHAARHGVVIISLDASSTQLGAPTLQFVTLEDTLKSCK